MNFNVLSGKMWFKILLSLIDPHLSAFLRLTSFSFDKKSLFFYFCMCDFSKITYLSYLRYLDLFFPKKTCAYLDLDKNKKYHRSCIAKGISLPTIAV